MQPDKKNFFSIKALGSGLLITQAVATIHVYFSNIRLYEQSQLILNAGYRSVPNENILPQLLNFQTAFWGAVFFTLTIGCFLSLLSIALAWGYCRVFDRSRWVLGAAFLVWLFLFWGVNAKELAVFESAYVLGVVPCVFAVSVRSMPAADKNPNLPRILLRHWTPLILLGLLWTSQPDQRMFIDFRDVMLLSTRPGLKITEFYYAYTLYPAEVFKPLDQKVLKTVHLETVENASLARRLHNTFLAFDYLPVDRNEAVDLVVSVEDRRLVFSHDNRRVLDVSTADFLKRPRKILKTLSERTDGSAFFRRLTFFSLLLGLPLCFYLVLRSIIRFVLMRFISLNAASLLSTALCFLFGASLLIPFYLSRSVHVDKPDIRGLMDSVDYRDRVSALKAIYEEKLEIGDYPSFRRMLGSASIPERYWLAMALRSSVRSDTLADLMRMVNDSHLNVVSKVFYALGRRGNTETIVLLLEKLKTSDHWYAQVYAYGALRELGWQQAELN